MRSACAEKSAAGSHQQLHNYNVNFLLEIKIECEKHTNCGISGTTNRISSMREPTYVLHVVTLFIAGRHKFKIFTCYASAIALKPQPQAPMKPLLLHPFNCLAGLAIVALLSACGGGGTAGQPSPPGAAAAASTAPAPAAAPSPSPASTDAPSNAATAMLASDVPVPQPASAPPQFSSGDPATGGYTLIPAVAPTDTGGEAPYPDLRNLPTRAMSFEPVVYGDVAGVAVTPAP